MTRKDAAKLLPEALSSFYLACDTTGLKAKNVRAKVGIYCSPWYALEVYYEDEAGDTYLSWSTTEHPRQSSKVWADREEKVGVNLFERTFGMVHDRNVRMVHFIVGLAVGVGSTLIAGALVTEAISF